MSDTMLTICFTWWKGCLKLNALYFLLENHLRKKKKKKDGAWISKHVTFLKQTNKKSGDGMNIFSWLR